MAPETETAADRDGNLRKAARYCGQGAGNATVFAWLAFVFGCSRLTLEGPRWSVTAHVREPFVVIDGSRTQPGGPYSFMPGRFEAAGGLGGGVC